MLILVWEPEVELIILSQLFYFLSSWKTMSSLNLHSTSYDKWTVRFVVPNKDLVMIYSHDRSVDGIVTGYGLDVRGVRARVPLGSRILTSPYRPDRSWGPSNLLSNGYRGLYLSIYLSVCLSVCLSVYLSIYLSNRKCRGRENVDLYIHSLIRLHGVVLN
jgi:hypothetical protein